MPDKSNTGLILGGLGIGAAIFAFLQKDEIAAAAEAGEDYVARAARGAADAVSAGAQAIGGAMKEATVEIIDGARLELFKLSIGDAAKYAEDILQVSKELDIDPFIIVGLGQQETRWGKALKADMTGDKTARDWTTVQIEKVPVKVLGVGTPTSKGVARYKVMPSDGLGWGRGLMQIDYASFFNWLTEYDWTDSYTNISKGGEVLKAKMKYVKSKTGLTGNDLLAAAIAAYNTGEGSVVVSLKAGKSVDSTTTGGNYSAKVLTYVGSALSRWASAGGSGNPTEVIA